MERQDLKLVPVVVTAVLAALGGAAFVAAFRPEDLVRPVPAAAAAAGATSLVVTGMLGRRLAISSAVTAFVLVAVAAVACEATPDLVLAGLQDGVRTLLTTSPPLRPEPEVLLVPYLLTGVAAFIGAELVQRGRPAVVAALPSLVVLVAGLLAGIDGRRPSQLLLIAVLWVGVALVTSSVSPRGLTGIATAVVVAVPLVTAARWIAPNLPGNEGREHFALRELVDQQGRRAPDPPISPLTAVTGLQSSDEDELQFTAETDAPVDRWRLAVLDQYDGSAWRSEGLFQEAGIELPRPPIEDGGTTTESGDRIEQSIEPAALDGPWLPMADRAVEVDIEGLLFDASGGVASVSEGATLPTRYRVVSEAPVIDTSRLAQATAATDAEAQRASELPEDVPEEITALAQEATEGSTSAYGRAVAIERLLGQPTDERPFELLPVGGPTGQATGDLRCFLIVDAECSPFLGSTDRFVAAYALLARSVGLPTRVVVGFEGSGAAGRDEVTAHEATAWAEVKFEGIGWVAFDPLPAPSVQITPPSTVLPGSSSGAPDSQPATTVSDDALNQTPGPEDEDQTADEAEDRAWLVWLGAGVGLVALVVLTPGLLRARRRRARRRSANEEARLAGAWATAVDELRRGGMPRPKGLAVTDIVQAGRQQYPAAGEPLVPLGVLVNRTRFGAYPPHGSEADQAWELTDAFVAGRRHGRPPSRRLREYFTVSV